MAPRDKNTAVGRAIGAPSAIGRTGQVQEKQQQLEKQPKRQQQLKEPRMQSDDQEDDDSASAFDDRSTLGEGVSDDLDGGHDSASDQDDDGSSTIDSDDVEGLSDGDDDDDDDEEEVDAYSEDLDSEDLDSEDLDSDSNSNSLQETDLSPEALQLKYLAPHDSEDEDFPDAVNPLNTIGNVPIEWYDDYPHIGYDLNGRRILKPATKDELDAFLDKMDEESGEGIATLRDHTRHADVQLTDQELAIVRKLHAGQHPDADYDPYPEFPDMFTQDVEQMPLSAAPEPKRRFIPSKWEHQRVMKIVRAIRKGLIVPGSQAKRELDEQRALLKPRFYNMWSDEVDRERDDAATKHIPAPKMKLPEHAESYNPPEEYLPTAEEVAAYQDLDAEDRPRNYLPQKYPNLRSVPSYARFINERFARCLDLYLCPRAMKKRVVDPETLLPDLPDPKELEPFPKQLTVEYRGHAGLVRSLSVDPSGQWLATGSDDKTARVWEVSTGRCVVMWAFKEAVVSVVWNPSKDLALLAVVSGSSVTLAQPPMVGSESVQTATRLLLEKVKSTSSSESASGDTPKASVDWSFGKSTATTPVAQKLGNDVQLQLKHRQDVSSVTWHKKGDYFATVCPDGGNQSVLIHQLSKRQSQSPFTKAKGQVQCVQFHPTKPFLFVASQRYIRVYNLVRQELHKCLTPGVKWISSMDVHPLGDNLLVGSYDKRICWFDMDLSLKPYKTLRCHETAVRNVAYHRRYPLFASASDDGSVHVFHGMVYNDYIQNPLIVPVKILRAHEKRGALGALFCEFHPQQPWLFTSGADHAVRMFC